MRACGVALSLEHATESARDSVDVGVLAGAVYSDQDGERALEGCAGADEVALSFQHAA